MTSTNLYNIANASSPEMTKNKREHTNARRSHPVMYGQSTRKTKWCHIRLDSKESKSDDVTDVSNSLVCWSMSPLVFGCFDGTLGVYFCASM